LTSVLKRYRRMVYLAMGDVVDGDKGVLNGTLANGDVGLAPFHGLEDKVLPISIRPKLEEIKRGIARRIDPLDPARSRNLGLPSAAGHQLYPPPA
jgi:hypothetical protein